jgi:hypothetical protein
MFDTDKTPYEINFLGKKEVFGQNSLVAKSLFRFKASKRKYLVTIEHFNFGVDAIKYCDVKDKDSKNAYTKIFNDHDGFKVLATCLKIMHNLWKNNPNLSFAFYAAPRPSTFEKLKQSRYDRIIVDEQFQEKYIRSRFNVYEHAMINLFPPKYFWKAKDYKNCIYVLLNKKSRKGANRLHQIGKYLLENHEIIFEVEDKIQYPKKPMRIG